MQQSLEPEKRTGTHIRSMPRSCVFVVTPSMSNTRLTIGCVLLAMQSLCRCPKRFRVSHVSHAVPTRTRNSTFCHCTVAATTTPSCGAQFWSRVEIPKATVCSYVCPTTGELTLRVRLGVVYQTAVVKLHVFGQKAFFSATNSRQGFTSCRTSMKQSDHGPATSCVTSLARVGPQF